ncbi:MAG: hypothetical protein PHD97_00760 [Bacteroidales bacterium]|nr:hypothetical protein [Bacteroidales bacterium]
MKTLNLIFALFFLSASIHAQDVSVYDVKKADNKFVYNDKYVKVFINDNIKIQATADKDSLKSLKVVQKPTASTITIIVVKENYTGGKGVMLKITNPYNKKMKYKVEVKVVGGDKYEDFSIKEIAPGTTTKEIWTGDVESIVLSEFVLEQ